MNDYNVTNFADCETALRELVHFSGLASEISLLKGNCLEYIKSLEIEKRVQEAANLAMKITFTEGNPDYISKQEIWNKRLEVLEMELQIFRGP